MLDDEIFDIEPFIKKKYIIHVKGGFRKGGLKFSHIAKFSHVRDK